MQHVIYGRFVYSVEPSQRRKKDRRITIVAVPQVARCEVSQARGVRTSDSRCEWDTPRMWSSMRLSRAKPRAGRRRAGPDRAGPARTRERRWSDAGTSLKEHAVGAMRNAIHGYSVRLLALRTPFAGDVVEACAEADPDKARVVRGIGHPGADRARAGGLIRRPCRYSGRS